MHHEEPYENSPLEQKKVLEEQRLVFIDALERAREISKRGNDKSLEYLELDTIRDGLEQKLQTLLEEDKGESQKMPETDEEWKTYIERMERINRIHAMIADLYTDLDKTADAIDSIEAEFNALVQETLPPTS